MFKKSVFIGLVILMISNFTGIAYGKGETTGYLQIIYKSCECGMTNPHVYSCYAPFNITGKKIIGSFEISEDGEIQLPLVPLVPADRDRPEFEKQIINYSYKCPTGETGCPTIDVSGQLVVHKVSGKVMKVKGKKMLAFEVRLSIPECTVNICGLVFDHSMEPWSDQFLAPFQDGYHTERVENALFNYVVNFHASFPTVNDKKLQAFISGCVRT